jgi:dihydroneopterin aldolase
MDETAIAFETPLARAAATAPAGLVDRISVRDHVRAAEIGAFRAERGVTQRLRFNVVLEVAHHAAARDDDVDKVLSYDTILDAIDAGLAAERLNLLETLAERVAAGCLADPRALRVFVRIEKLDRIPGALGVEIARARLPEDAPRLHPVEAAPAMPGPAPSVIYLAPGLLAGPDAAAWLDALVTLPGRAVLCTGPAAPQPAATGEGALRVGLLAIDSAVWALADRDPRLTVAESRAELDWALRSGRRPVWAPARMLVDALPRPALDASRPEALAAWLAGRIGAGALALAGTAAEVDAPAGVAFRRAARPADLAAPDAP